MKQRVFFLFGLLLLALSSYAQVTTSSLTGLIKEAKGEPSIGATIRAVHMPSGTSYGVAANGEGRFTIQNMRIGAVTKLPSNSWAATRTCTASGTAA